MHQMVIREPVQKMHSLNKEKGVYHDQILKESSGSIKPDVLTQATWNTFTFGFIHYGGNNNLNPGRPETISVPLGAPSGSFPLITGTTYSDFGFFELDNGVMKNNETKLAQSFQYVYFDGHGNVCCEMLLTDGNGQTPCYFNTWATVLFFYT